MRDDQQREFRRQLRRDMTAPERLLWSRLRRQQLDGLKFRRQHPLGPFVLDFFCAERRVAIEIDGACHYADAAPARDRRRDAFLASQGVRVLRFTNPEVLADVDAVVAAIGQALA
jgi:very-short-patch-repair endonuclease